MKDESGLDDPSVDEAAGEPVDADVGGAADRVEGSWGRPPGEAAVVAVIAGGGVLGSLARYAAGLWWPTGTGRFPWTTLGVNAVGCALIGVLLVLVTDVFSVHRLVRPLLGTGVLGGFTTFSTYAVDSQRLITTGHAGLGLANIGLTMAVAIAAVTVATKCTRLSVAGMGLGGPR